KVVDLAAFEKILIRFHVAVAELHLLPRVEPILPADRVSQALPSYRMAQDIAFVREPRTIMFVRKEDATLLKSGQVRIVALRAQVESFQMGKMRDVDARRHRGAPRIRDRVRLVLRHRIVVERQIFAQSGDAVLEIEARAAVPWIGRFAGACVAGSEAAPESVEGDRHTGP